MLKKSNWSIERVVVLLTPFFGAFSSWFVVFVATHVPSAPHLSATGVEGVVIGVFVTSGGVVIKWLHGRQIPAIAGLPPISQQQRADLEAEVHDILARSPISGPPGPPGPTTNEDRVRELIREELAAFVSSAAKTAPAPASPQ